MMRKYMFLVLCGFLFLLPLTAEGQSQPSGQTGRSRSDLGGALSTMDSALVEDEEATTLDEYYLGRAVAANILTVYRPYTRNPDLTAYLNRICQTIAINSPQPEIFNGYHVIIFDSAEFNAFASPGGHILISRGLVESVASEDALAAVIAHEFAHIYLKHGTAIIADMRLNDSLTAAADRASQIASRDSSTAARTAFFRDSVNKMVEVMMKSGYAQAQEFEADAAAVTFLAAAGYNPSALLELLRILQRSSGGGMGGFASTHPSPAARITNVEPRVARYNVQDTSAYRKNRFKNK